MCVVMSRFVVFNFIMLSTVEKYSSAVGVSLCLDSKRSCDSRNLIGCSFTPRTLQYLYYIFHSVFWYILPSSSTIFNVISSFNSSDQVASFGFLAGGYSSSVFFLFPACCSRALPRSLEKMAF